MRQELAARIDAFLKHRAAARDATRHMSGEDRLAVDGPPRPVERRDVRHALNLAAVALNVAAEAVSDAHRALRVPDDSERPTIPTRPMTDAERRGR